MPHNMYLHSALVKVGSCASHVTLCSFVQHSIFFMHHTYHTVQVKETAYNRFYREELRIRT